MTLSPKAFKRNFIGRLRSIREGTRLSQTDFARELGISPTRYAKYEHRSLLPMYLIERVCEITHIDSWYLITGRVARPKEQEAIRKTG